MKFHSRQRINGTVEEVERALFDDRYHAFLLEHHGVLLEVQPLERHEDNGLIKRKVRYRPKPVIKHVGTREVPPEWFAFIEQSTWDPKKKEFSFSNVPTNGNISKMLINTGAFRLRDLGGGQSERDWEGEIRLVLPFLMKPLAIVGEQVIHREGMKILDGELPVLNRFIAEVLRK